MDEKSSKAEALQVSFKNERCRTLIHSYKAFATGPGLELKYSGHQVEMHFPFPPLLEEIAARLASPDCLGSEVKFNHAMLNRYEDGSIYIGRHSDNGEKQNEIGILLSPVQSRTKSL